MKNIILIISCNMVIATLAACSPGGSSSDAYQSSDIRFPSDEQVSAALREQFAQDPNSASARELVRTLGGEKGLLRYRVRHVLYLQGPFEARYDAVLQLGQPGTRSLQTLYGTMIPEADRQKLAAQDLQHYEDWLKQYAASLQKSAPEQASALTRSMEMLGKCYRGAKEGEEIVVMQGLAARLIPERSGLFAEKIPAAATTVHCLPT